MMYENLNDNELIELSLENNEEATNIIIKKYKNIIIKTLKEYQKKYQIHGIEMADLYQEGLIGLITAIDTFNKNKDILFYTYASVCIRTSIMSEIRRTFRIKNRILNNSYSLDMLYDDTKESLYEIIKDETIESIKSNLSKSELSIFELKLSGLSNSEIASLLNKNKKYVENAISRIIKKYKSNK